MSDRAKRIKDHPHLADVLKKTPFKLLQNQTVAIHQGDLKLNLTGLGEYVLDRADPEAAFKGVDPSSPGIILVHNPDMVPKLLKYPGNLILSGHTHGGQVNLPWIWKKLTLMEQIRFKEGRIEEDGKTVFVSRGVGSVKPFRWNAPPELVLIELRGDS